MLDLAELEARRRRRRDNANPLNLCTRIGEAPHAGQLPLLADRHRFKIVCCGTRWGKSWAAARWAAARMLAPCVRGWIVSGTYDLADKVFREIVALFRLHGAVLGVRVTRCTGNKDTGQFLALSNGSWVCTKSADHPDSMDAEGLDFAVADEAAKYPSLILHRHLIPRLTDRRGSLLAISTARGRNHFYDLFRMAEESQRTGSDPEWAAYSAPSSTNPHVFQLGAKDPEWLRLRAQFERAHMLPLFEQEYEGSFASMAGRVIAAWNPAVHVRPLAEVTVGVEEWRLAVDWGLRRTGMLAIGRTKAKQYRIVAEIYREGLLPDDRRDEALALAKAWRITRGWGDPADPTSNTMLVNAGLKVSPANNDRDDGILYLCQKFGEPGGVMIAEGACPNLEHEIENWTWRATAGAREIQEPVKRDDHLIDAMRYGAYSWERLTDESTSSTRWEVARRLTPAQEREIELRRMFAAGKRVGEA